MNTRGAVATALACGFLLTVFVARVLMHRRRTGDWGVRLQRSTRAERWSGAGFVTAIVALILGSILAAAALTTPFEAAASVLLPTGLAVFLAATTFTVAAQQSMGASWRIGVQDGETTELVRTGPFSLARNPIFTGMIAASVGLTAISPTPITIGATALLVLTIELQVRLVEEPHLRSHVAGWTRYASQTGRFVPVIGRLDN